jgi:hypothetical protein
MGIRKRGIDEQWLTLRSPGIQAVASDRDIAFAEIDGVIANLYATLTAAGNGAMTVEIKNNGVTLFGAGANKVTFANGATVAGTVDPIAARKVRKGDRFTMDVTAVPAGPGSGLAVHIQILRRYGGAERHVSPGSLS